MTFLFSAKKAEILLSSFSNQTSACMAQPLIKKQLKDLPVMPYDKVRDFIQTGHIFFSSGSYFFFKRYTTSYQKRMESCRHCLQKCSTGPRDGFGS